LGQRGEHNIECTEQEQSHACVGSPLGREEGTNHVLAHDEKNHDRKNVLTFLERKSWSMPMSVSPS
jgi:hypothetical protein